MSEADLSPSPIPALGSRMLIVDDEPQVIEGLRFVMRRQRASWEVVFAEDGASALARCEERPFDVVVSDMRMPGMDGAQLLRQIRERHPDTIRILLSAYAEQEALMRAVPVAHQYLAKPCGVRELQGCIDRIRNLRALINGTETRSVLGEIETVPSLPTTFVQLGEAIANPRSNAQAIAKIVERDAGMSAKVLQLVNSAFFGLGHQMSKISDAVTYLGFNLVKSLVLSVGIFEKFSGSPAGFHPEALQARAMLTGLLGSRLVARELDIDSVFMSAILQDIGQLVLASRMPKPFAEALRCSREGRIPLHLAEERVMGTNHAVVGAYLLGIWGLPTTIVEAVAFRHRPVRTPPIKLDVMAALHIADRLIEEVSLPDPADQIEPLDPAYLELLGVGDKLAGWRKSALGLASRVE